MEYKDYLDKQLIEYASFEGEQASWVYGQRNFILAWLSDLDKEFSILDIGCGDGTGMQCLREAGFKYLTGIDANESKAERARALGFPVYCLDFHDIPLFFSAEFDVVYSSHSLEHALYPEKVLENIYRVLSTEGFFVCVLPYPDTGPDDVHVGKYKLGTCVKDNGITTIKFIESFGFKCINHCRDSLREPELWMFFKKQ